jgi:hypothetical protein
VSGVATVKERIEQDELVFDNAVVSHGFAPHLRDYDVVVDVAAARPDGSGGYIAAKYLYRFTHCTEAHVVTALATETWARSWDDHFTDHTAWESAGAPEGFVWGVCFADAYPGLSYVDESKTAREWSSRLGREMHGVVLQTNAFTLRVVFHDLAVEQLAVGDPASDELRPLT